MSKIIRLARLCAIRWPLVVLRLRYDITYNSNAILSLILLPVLHCA